MLEGFNIWLWLALIPSYYLYEYYGTKNQLATNKLKAVRASNTGALMYVIGIVGTYLCVKEGLINIIPILIGSWFGTYYSIKWEKNKNKIDVMLKELLVKVKGLCKSKLAVRVEELEARVAELEAINVARREANKQRQYKKNKNA